MRKPVTGSQEDLGVRDRRRRPRRASRSGAVLPGQAGRPVRAPPGSRGGQRPRRAPPARSRSRSTRSSTRSSPGNGLRQRASLRTSRSPTPAGPPHLCADSGGGRPAGGQGEPAGRGAGVHEQRHRGPVGDLGHRLDDAHLRVGRLEREDGGPSSAATAARPRRGRPGRAGPQAGSRPRPPRSRVPGRRRAGPPSARRRRPAAGRPARPRPPAGRARRGGTAWVPLGVKVTSSGRDRRGTPPRRPGRCRASAGPRGPDGAAAADRRTPGPGPARAPAARRGAAARPRRGRGRSTGASRRPRQVGELAHRAQPTRALPAARGSLSSRVSTV